MNSETTVLAILAIMVLIGLGILIVPLLQRKKQISRHEKILKELTLYNDNILAICSKTHSLFDSHQLSRTLIDNRNVQLLFQKWSDMPKTFKRIRGQIIHLHPEHPEIHNYMFAINQGRVEFKDAELTLGIISNALTALVGDICEQSTPLTDQERSFIADQSVSIEHLAEGKRLAKLSSQQFDELELQLNGFCVSQK